MTLHACLWGQPFRIEAIHPFVQGWSDTTVSTVLGFLGERVATVVAAGVAFILEVGGWWFVVGNRYWYKVRYDKWKALTRAAEANPIEPMTPFDGTQSYKQLAKWMERLRNLKHDSDKE